MIISFHTIHTPDCCVYVLFLFIQEFTIFSVVIKELHLIEQQIFKMKKSGNKMKLATPGKV